MRARLLSLGVSAFLVVAYSTPVQAMPTQAAMDDLANDWTGLSPRLWCFNLAGAKDIGSGRYTRKSLRDLERDRPGLERRAERTIAENTGRTYNAGWEYSGYLASMKSLLSTAGEIAARPDFDRNLLISIMNAVTSLKPPVSSRGDNDPLFTNKLEAEILRECALEYVAVAFGIGEPQGLARYNRALALWRTGRRSGETAPEWYVRSLTSLNYLVAREQLAAGNQASAFQLASDPTMSNTVLYTASWVASFHTFGIGTPRSLPKALAVFEKGNATIAKIEAAALKAQLGRKNEAVSDLRTFMTGEWSGSWEFSRANMLYSELTGSKWAAPSKPGFWEAVMVVPLAIAAYCAKLPNGCASSSGSQAGYNYWTDDPIQKQRRDQMSRDQFVSDWYDVQNRDY